MANPSIWNLPNILTVARIVALIPLMWLGWKSGSISGPDSDMYRHLTAWVFLLVFLTDSLDGYLARKWNQITDLGKLLDPMADKLLVLCALVILVEQHVVPGWSAVIIMGREIAVTGLRGMASAQHVVISAGSLGKAKTVFQSISLTALLHFDSVFGSDIAANVYGYPIFWASVALSLISGIEYYAKFFMAIQSGKSSQDIQSSMDQE